MRRRAAFFLAWLLLAGAVLTGCDAAERAADAARRQRTAETQPPPSRGLDSLLLARAHDRADSLSPLRSLLIARHGEMAREWYFHGADPDEPANLKSASKSVLSALVGIAIAEGELVGPDQPVAGFFEEELPADADPRLRRVTIGHLLSMRSGLRSTSFGNYGAWVTSPNWVRHVLSRPFVDEPGGDMIYSTGSTHLLSAILTRATGVNTRAYANEHLAGPLGFELPWWPRDPQGIYFGGNDMRMRPRDLLRFGELYQNDGRHDGRQVVPAEWIETSWRPRTRSPWNGNGYGYGWWTRRFAGYETWFAWGYGGQYLFIVPALELTVVMTSDPSPDVERRGHRRAQMELLSRYLIPAAERGAREAGS